MLTCTIKPQELLMAAKRRKRSMKNVKQLFGRFKFKESAQKIKDELRKEWDD
jgi:hypothetical protein